MHSMRELHSCSYLPSPAKMEGKEPAKILQDISTQKPKSKVSDMAAQSLTVQGPRDDRSTASVWSSPLGHCGGI